MMRFSELSLELIILISFMTAQVYIVAANTPGKVCTLPPQPSPKSICGNFVVWLKEHCDPSCCTRRHLFGFLLCYQGQEQIATTVSSIQPRNLLQNSNRLGNYKRPNAFPSMPQTRTSTTTSDTRTVEQRPVQRGVTELKQAHTLSPTTRYRQRTCVSRQPRRDCGYPGITAMECLNKQCCWDNRDTNNIWCFNKVFIEDSSSSVNRFSSLGNTSYPDNGNTGQNKQIVIERSSENPYITDNARKETQSVFNSSDLVHPSSDSNIAVPRQPSSKTKNNFETTQIYVDSPHTPGFHSNISNQKISKSEAASSSIQHSSKFSSESSTATPTTTEQDVLPPYTDDEDKDEGISIGALSPPTPLQAHSDEDIAAVLKLLDEIERQRRPKPDEQTNKVCKLNNGESCCKAYPKGPCCEFRDESNLLHRAAPVTRIVGGIPAGSLRHSVAYLSKYRFGNHFCGGTLIDAKWVLTAAHCVLEYCYQLTNPRYLFVSLGKYRRSYFHEPGQQNIRVSKVICHANQCKSKGYPRLNDVALIRLSWAAVVTTHVAPALLPSPHESPNPNRNCITLGWGKTKGSGYDGVIKQVSVPLVTNQKCNKPGWRNCVIRACMMCAGDVNIDACDGDSGGPLFCARSNGLYVLHGIFSWGRCGASVRKPSVYTRTSYYVRWMTSTMQKNRDRT